MDAIARAKELMGPEVLDAVLPFFCDREPVGSQVTCDPPPSENTDFDVLIGVPVENEEQVNARLLQLGFKCPESSPASTGYPCSFFSCRRGDLNLIIVTDSEFYSKFTLATRVAKKLNLLKKEDRVFLFQAILYGNG